MAFEWALQTYEYSIDGVRAYVGELLLACFGYGIFLIRPEASRTEKIVMSLRFLIRHDDFAAGSKVPGLGSGAGRTLRCRTRASIGTSSAEHKFEVAAGLAYLPGASMLFRYGGTKRRTYCIAVPLWWAALYRSLR